MPVITAVRAEAALDREEAAELAAVFGADAPSFRCRQEAGHGIAESAARVLPLLTDKLQVCGGQGVDSVQVILHGHVCSRRPKAAASGIKQRGQWYQRQIQWLLQPQRLALCAPSSQAASPEHSDPARRPSPHRGA